MTKRLDHQSPVPLYHQISETIRYRIATGELRPGSVLPPLRDAARLWGANLHTVRRAYAELASDGLVATRVPHGTVVLAQEAPSEEGGQLSPAVGRFLARVVRDARSRHGLDIDGLVGLLRSYGRAPAAGEPPRVYVSECSETQSKDLARQVMARWEVSAVPWPTDRPAPPPGSTVIATYFHYQEIALRWPSRLRDVRFMAIGPDPALEKALRKRAGTRRPAPITLCEKEAPMLANILADLARVLPAERYRILPKLVPEPSRWLAPPRASAPILFSPRLWGELPEETKRDPRLLEVRYVFNPWELDEIGPLFGWRRK